MSKYERANQFWADARARVLAIAHAADLDVSLKAHDDEFLYDLFDCGSYEPTDEEIIESLEEYAFE